MSVTVTTALRKISSLKKKIWGLQGGQGAGKTYSVLMLIINHSISNPNKEIYIASAELSKMRDTVIKDCINILRAFNKYEEVKCTGIDFGQPKIEFPNNTFIRFIGLDKEDVGKGLRSDIMFVNEANKIKFETYRELTSRAKRIIIDFNPNAIFWFHKEVQKRNDCDFLLLTYLDNEYLSKEEVNEILNYKQQGFINPYLEDYDRSDNIKSEYWANKWRIYGLGQIGGVEGRIFFWKSINYHEYLKIDAPTIYTADWGKQDPFAIGEMKYYDGQLFNHELNYRSENEWMKKLTSSQLTQITGRDGDGFITWMFDRLNIPKNAYIICDSNRPEKIKSLRRAGWTYAVAVDGSSKKIIDGIDLLHNLDVYYTDTSENIEYEQRVYCWDTDKNDNPLEKPVDRDNHHCFVGETLINTSTGLRRIDSIKKGEYVYTSKGLNKVVNTFDNGIKEIIELSIQTDTFLLSLRCTKNHLFKTQRGWIQAIQLKSTDKIYLYKHSMEKNTNYTKVKTTIAEDVKDCIGSYGNTLAASQYQKDMMYIMLMEINTTIVMKTLTLCKGLYICVMKAGKGLKKIPIGLKGFMKKVLNQLKSGTNQKRGEIGMLNMVKKSWLNESILKNNASNVKSLTKQDILENLIFVQTNVNHKIEEIQELTMLKENAFHVEKNLLPTNIQKLSVVEDGVDRVYDLEVENQHEYFANGVLVHNCDRIRYGAMFWQKKGVIKKV